MNALVDTEDNHLVTIVALHVMMYLILAQNNAQTNNAPFWSSECVSTEHSMVNNPSSPQTF